MPLVNRYTQIIQGGITSTGNTLAINSTNPSTYLQNAFISTNTALQVPGFPIGTTTNYTQNSSNAYLNIPTGSTIVYAELMWTALGNFTSAVTLSTPVQSNISVSPTNNDGYPTYNLYWHSADVSSYIQAGGSGYYTVGNVQCTFSSGGAMCPSWTLMVAYKNQNLPYRYVTVNTGFSFVAGSPGNTFTISNFVTPSTGTPTGYLLMAYTAGDFGDSANLRVGATTSSYTAIGNPGPISSPWNGVSPYNPQGQMFPGLICIADPLNSNLGNIDTRGNFGNSNLTSYVTQTYNTFSRTLYDISGFNISKALTINQNTLNVNVFFTNPTGGAIIQNESVQVDVQSANLAPLTKSVSEGYGTLGDTLIFTVTTANIGLLPANNVIFIDTTPNGTTFQTGSVIVNNVAQPTYDPNPPNGISLGTIAPNAVTTIIFSAKVNASIPFTSNPIKNQSTLGYSFVPGTGISPVITSVESNTTTTTINFVSLSSSKSVNKRYANILDVLTYTIPITNNGTITATNVSFIDTIPNGTTIVPGSFKQDGIVVPGSGTPNPPGSTLSNSIKAGGVSTISFQVTVITVPVPNPIPNTATATCSYTIDTTTTPNRVGSTSTNTNTVNTQINFASLNGIVKYVDKSYTTCGEVITYTIVAPNTGTVTAQNVVFLKIQFQMELCYCLLQYM